MNLNEYKVVANPLLTVAKSRDVPRTWKERLFSWPWQPMKKTKVEVYHVPSREVIVDKVNHVIYAHPEVKAEIERAIDYENKRMMFDCTFPNPMRRTFGGIVDIYT